MRGSINCIRTGRRMLFQSILFAVTAVGICAASVALAQDSSAQVEGVKNFGRVTERYIRGGEVTPAGIENLAAMGVRIIIDLRDSPNPDEPEVSRRNGIRYLNFPMTGHEAPDDKIVDEILSIIQSAKEPVYVHCSAGKHRAGTIAALYRIRVQGWSKERAWAEQQSYGFGAPEEHPELYAYVYGAGMKHQALSTSTSPDKDKKKPAKAKKDDESDDGDHRRAANRKAAGLSAEAGYIPVTEAILRARSEGGSGEVLKVDLEWDPARAVATWDVTFSSGSEYEIDATTGKLLDTKPKPPAKLAVFAPLELDGNRLLTFQEIIRKAESKQGQSVMEMELKRIKGRSQVIYEVVLADGSTLYYDAATGSDADGI